MSLRYRTYARLFAIGALFHLALPDAHQPGWLIPNLLLGTGALLLFVRAPGRGPLLFVAWGACGLGTLLPLFLLGDQLTQSVIMTCHAIAMLTLLRRSESDATAAVRWITLAVYGIAAFHKLNADFVDPAVSCASGGMTLLADNWSLPIAPEALAGLWPPVFLAVEIGLVVLFVLRPALALLLALAMHIPLTIIFAPAFAWVMIPGWVAFLREDDVAHIVATARERWRRVLVVGLVPGIVSAALYFQDHWVPYPFWQLAELALWLLAAVVVVAFIGRGDRLTGRCAWEERTTRLALLPALVLIASAATPYLGLQFHHAGAMLSNLRIDEGCWNHFLVPEAVRIEDLYVRLDDVRVGGDVQGPDVLADHAEERLWHPANARAAVARWCDAGAAPLEMDVTYRGRRRHVEDACAGGLGLPEQREGLFQTNLMRECPQRCIH